MGTKHHVGTGSRPALRVKAFLFRPVRLRMNILLIQDILRSGGTERQTILLAQGFAAAGHASEVVTFRPGGTLASSLSPVRHSSLQTFDTTLNWFAPGLVRTARSASPDVVLCMG